MYYDPLFPDNDHWTSPCCQFMYYFHSLLKKMESDGLTSRLQALHSRLASLEAHLEDMKGHKETLKLSVENVFAKRMLNFLIFCIILLLRPTDQKTRRSSVEVENEKLKTLESKLAEAKEKLDLAKQQLSAKDCELQAEKERASSVGIPNTSVFPCFFFLVSGICDGC